MRPLLVTLVLAQTAACSANESSGPAADGSAGSGAASSGGSGGSGGGGGTGAREIGDPCTTNADCAAVPGAECWTTIGGGPVPTITFPGGFCSKACSNEGGNECGTIAGCATVGVSGGMGSATLSMCTPPCTKNEDCRAAEGYRCLVLLPGVGVCTL